MRESRRINREQGRKEAKTYLRDARRKNGRGEQLRVMGDRPEERKSKHEGAQRS